MQRMQEMWVQSLSQGRSPGVENNNPLQYSCLENSMGRGARRATVSGASESDSTERLSTIAHTHDLVAESSKKGWK